MEMEIGRKLYSIREAYWIYYKGLRTMKCVSRAKKKGELSSQFIERIMLAVTEVNGCDLCSYAHTRMALEAGMSSEEIQNILAGSIDDIPDDEAIAILFAQHYADTRGNPTRESWERIVKTYGIVKSKYILGAICNIMMGNAFGIPLSAIVNRFKGNPDKRSSLIYEVSMILSNIVILPICIIHATISNLHMVPITNKVN